MQDNDLIGGTVHPMPKDLRIALIKDDAIVDKWENLTPLARNEWICWVIPVKQQNARNKHITRLVSELKEGKRRLVAG